MGWSSETLNVQCFFLDIPPPNWEGFARDPLRKQKIWDHCATSPCYSSFYALVPATRKKMCSWNTLGIMQPLEVRNNTKSLVPLLKTNSESHWKWAETQKDRILPTTNFQGLSQFQGGYCNHHLEKWGLMISLDQYAPKNKTTHIWNHHLV